MIEGFKLLFEQMPESDIRIVCSGDRVVGHRCILSARSKV